MNEEKIAMVIRENLKPFIGQKIAPELKEEIDKAMIDELRNRLGSIPGEYKVGKVQTLWASWSWKQKLYWIWKQKIGVGHAEILAYQDIMRTLSAALSTSNLEENDRIDIYDAIESTQSWSCEIEYLHRCPKTFCAMFVN